MTRDIKYTFDIYSINYCLEQIYVEEYNPDDDKDYEDTLESVIRNINYSGYCNISKKHCPFDYDYETEIWFLKGIERKKLLKHMKNYIEEYEAWNWDLVPKNYWCFWSISNTYAYLYIKNNSEEWFGTLE